MAQQNLGNAAFFATKKLDKKILELEHRLEVLEKAFLLKEISNNE